MQSPPCAVFHRAGHKSGPERAGARRHSTRKAGEARVSGGTDLDRGRVSQPTTAQKMRVVLAVLPFNMCVHLLKCADTVNASRCRQVACQKLCETRHNGPISGRVQAPLSPRTLCCTPPSRPVDTTKPRFRPAPGDHDILQQRHLRQNARSPSTRDSLLSSALRAQPLGMCLQRRRHARTRHALPDLPRTHFHMLCPHTHTRCQPSALASGNVGLRPGVGIPGP